MRRSLVRFSTSVGKHAGILSSPFSSSAGGRGRGCAGGVDPKFDFVRTAPGKPTSEEQYNEDNNNVDTSRFQSSSGHGRGINFVPPISSVPGSINPVSSAAGRGRGGGVRVPGDNYGAGRGGGDRTSVVNPGAGGGDGVRVSGAFRGVSVSGDDDVPMNSSGAGRGGGSGIPSRPDPRDFGPRIPDFIQRMEEEEKSSDASDTQPDFVIDRAKGDENYVRSNLMTALSGAGRGKTDDSGIGIGVGVKQENRHVRVRPQFVRTDDNVNVRTPSKKLSPEDAKKNAMDILSRGSDGGVGGGDRERVMESGGRGGGRGRGRGRGARGFRGRGRGGRFGGRGERQEEDDDDDGLYLGDAADGEKLAERLGTDNMNKLVEGFEEISENVLPSLEQDAFIDAMHVNYAIECEPEYLMGDFESNPDIDEKPPMSLRDALEKAKPFLMAYENIQSHEEWEEAVEDAMKQVPLMKEIVDYYSGPDRVTAKQQMEELERVAKILPESAPDSVKRFTNRAVLSLQSNPGWGFDKKCQFMDKLVWEVSQQYK